MLETPEEDLEVAATARGVFLSKLLAPKDPVKAKPVWKVWLAVLGFLALLAVVTILAA